MSAIITLLIIALIVIYFKKIIGFTLIIGVIGAGIFLLKDRKKFSDMNKISKTVVIIVMVVVFSIGKLLAFPTEKPIDNSAKNNISKSNQEVKSTTKDSAVPITPKPKTNEEIPKESTEDTKENSDQEVESTKESEEENLEQLDEKEKTESAEPSSSVQTSSNSNTPVQENNFEDKSDTDKTFDYMGNSNSMKFHYTSCSSAKKTNESNRVYFNSRDKAINNGYVPCKRCNP